MSSALAQALWDARVNARVIDPAPATLPTDEAGAYDLQAAITAIGGAEVVGFKIGATAQPTLDLMGLSQPFFGPLYERYCSPNGAEVAINPAQKAGLETEFSVCLGQDLPSGREYKFDDIEAALEWVAPAFEIIGFRVAGEVAGAGTRLIADGGANVNFVHGEPVRDWRQFDFTSHPAALHINGKEVASGHAGMSIFENALAALVWLANHRTNSRGLRAGDVITTGTVTGITPLEAGMTARGDFGALGEVRCTFVSV
ncbi:MAG: hypothetical protein K0U93_22815 [Gammaproteobacteria bacterium]|nr:hypothetical protein [Gammaproteobacteria bacterium]